MIGKDLFVSVLCALFMIHCSGPASSTQETDEPDTEIEMEGPDTERAEDTLPPTEECTEDSDCGEVEICESSRTCVQGSCAVEPAPAGSDCGTFCNPGVCSEKGECGLQPPTDCPDIDGNLCTVPTCDVDADECREESLPTGASPYAENDCYIDAICVDGIVDTTNAGPSETALGCDALSENLDPLGCVDRYECVGGDVGCEPVFRPEGSQCWAEGGNNGNTCIGHSCVAGNCAVDTTYEYACTADELGETCGEECAECTEFSCLWIDDPSNPASSEKVPYCQAAATIGESCSLNSSCGLEQVCILGNQTEGPLGKETLGICSGGTEKTKEDCAEEMGLPPLPCILAGMVCDSETGGCTLDEELTSNWCSPPSSLCYDSTNTYCTHLDSGENWDAETGCHIAWADVDCDDGTSCTVDVCSKDDGAWVCAHEPVEGASCDDGDDCTTAGLCSNGTCAGIVAICQDLDDNPCTTVLCENGGCIDGVLLGEPCDDGDLCSILSVCTAIGCGDGLAIPCDDGNACTDDYCDPLLGCSSFNALGSCDDGDGCTLNDTCGAGICSGTPNTSCDDGVLCTDDFCAEGSCTATPNTALCDDGNSCTENDICSGGSCAGEVGLVSCTDFNNCTEDLCLPEGGCAHNNFPNGFPCDGGGANSCQNGSCVCTPSCDGVFCGNENGCGGICGCEESETCSAGKCVTGGVDYDGTWVVNGNNGMVTNTMVLDFDAASNTVTGVGEIAIIGASVPYTGTYNHPNFTLEGTYDLPFFGTHIETWDLTLNSPTSFSGTLQDTGETNDFIVNGVKTN